ncbi:MAG: hypothetical protein IJ667_01570 [Synergistaceae bacterium]|nr:hypothetical protein [Synergistaceae bacterium]
MDKCFIFRDYTNNAFYPLRVYLDRQAGYIAVNANDIKNILHLSAEDIQNLAEKAYLINLEPLLKFLKSKPELRQHSFKDWFEFQILPRIIDEFNSFTPNDALEEISDTLEEIKEILEDE